MTDDSRPFLRSRLTNRLLSTGRLAASAAHLGARRLFRAEGPLDGRIGDQLARELDQMKGMAMKVGQILSYFEGVLPPDTHAALRVLQQGVTTMRYEQVADVIRAAFGVPVEELYEEFDPAPVAGASIGQVHRARFDGRPVAVKVQYPGILDSIESDFSRLRGLGRLATIGIAADGLAIADELRERVGLECDYLREAAAQTAFRAAFGADEEIAIPPAITERTRPTVLTTGWADGRDFYEFQRSATAAERDAAGLVLLRFAYRSFFELETVNADPHPGNYLFPPRAPIVFLDFGCIRPFDSAFVGAERRLARAVVEDRRSDFREAALATGAVADPERFDFDHYWAMLCHQYAPYRAREFEFTLDYVREAMEYGHPRNPNLRRIAIRPEWIWLQRLQWGLHAVLARLGVRGSFSDLMREFVALEPNRLTIPETPAAVTAEPDPPLGR